MEILVVDDNKDICLLIENILLSEGYDVETCCTPIEFMAIMKHSNPQLIITDLLMSGYDGRTLTKEIKGNKETAHIKILMMSAHPDAKILSETAGVDDFITKPFEIDELIKKVAFLLR